ncbi:MAG: tail fiber domain-containing protein [Planctomycetes bacterium]|nr:tail fiber domain-containing protein [Planctomycetota bacterium]
MRHRIPIAFLMILTGMMPMTARAQTPLGTGFTYQGRLDETGVPVNGEFPMVFTLWDSATGGGQVGPSLSFDGLGGHPAPISVTNGLFTATLDFGTGTMGPNTRWLETTVNGVTLSPRQKITPAPSALFSAAPWASSGSTISYTGGNVGIGTASPLSLLHARSGGDCEIGLESSSPNGRRWTLQSSSGALGGQVASSFQIIDRTVGLSRVLIDTIGRVGIGTSSPANWLSVAGTADFSGPVAIGTTSTSNPLTLLSVAGDADFSGKVGIGTSSPSNRLTVAGNANFTANVSVAGGVGIGTASPTRKLEVRGFSDTEIGIISDTPNAHLWTLQSSNGMAGGQLAASFQILDRTLEASRLLIDTNGRVGIGTAGPDQRLTVNGDASKPGGGSWAAFSDPRLKHDIRPMSGTLDTLLSLHGYSFEYNADAVASGKGLPGRQLGLMADEVERVFPDWVSRNDAGYRCVTERATTALMVESLRDLRQEKDAEISSLRAEKDAQIRDLTERLARLEAMIAGKGTDSRPK